MVVLWFTHVTVVLQILRTLLQILLCNSYRPMSEVRHTEAHPNANSVPLCLSYATDDDVADGMNWTHSPLTLQDSIENNLL